MSALRERIILHFKEGCNKDPREHQVACVEQLIDSLSNLSSSSNYLIQASVGSGKSLMIAALVRELLDLDTRKEKESESEPVSDPPGAPSGSTAPQLAAILIVNDRIQLDLQLSSTVSSYLANSGIDASRIERASSVDRLGSLFHTLAREATDDAPTPSDDGPVVIFSTLQKVSALFRRNVREGKSATALPPHRRVIVIADEAHRSHSANSSDQFHALLAGRDGVVDTATLGAKRKAHDGGNGTEGNKFQAVRDQPKGLVYVAFTATPSETALKLFGVRETYLDFDTDTPASTSATEGVREAGRAEGEAAGPGPSSSSATQLAQSSFVYRPFFSFTMDQAVESGVILDPLKNYALVSTRMQILQATSLQATGGKLNESSVIDAASASRDVVERKCEFIVQKLRGLVPQLGVSGAKVMVVVRSRQHVLWFTEGLRRRIGRLLSKGPAASGAPPSWPTHESVVFGTFSGTVSATAAAGEYDDGAEEGVQKDGLPEKPPTTSAPPTAADDDDDDETPLRDLGSNREASPATAPLVSRGASVTRLKSTLSRASSLTQLPETTPRGASEEGSPSLPPSTVDDRPNVDDAQDSDEPQVNDEEDDDRMSEGDEEIVADSSSEDEQEEGAGDEPPPGSAEDGVRTYALSEDDLNRPCGATLANAEIIVLCGKLETGYDEPRLCVGFIDRPLNGSRAVQVLGRLIRPAPALGKTSDSIHVWDFVNSAGQVRDSFTEFYSDTRLYVGPHATRRRRLIEMERCMMRLLEALEPAARSISPHGLGALSSLRCASLIRAHPPHVRITIEADLKSYLRLSLFTGVECQELPYVFAQGVDRSLTRLRKEAASDDPKGARGAKGGEEGEDGAGAGEAGLDVKLEAVDLLETFRGSLSLASISPQGLQTGISGLQPHAAAAALTPKGAPQRAPPIFRQRTGNASVRSSDDVRGLGSGSTFIGRLRAGADTSYKSLMKKDPPLAELIKAANRSLEGKFSAQVDSFLRSVASGLLEYAQRKGGSAQWVLDQLRRLELQQMTADRLKQTGLGQAVNALRKSEEPVASAARRLVQRWKEDVQREVERASKAKEGAAARGGEGSAAAAAGKKAPDVSKSVLDAAAMSSLRGRMRDALRSAVQASAPQDVAADLPAEISHRLEECIFQHFGGPAATNVEGLKEYQSRTRALLLSLKDRRPGNLRDRLLSGAISVEETATTKDELLLAPDEVRQKVEEEKRIKEERSREWRDFVDAMSFLPCIKCHQVKAVSYTTITGGTYAQDKEPIVMYTCTACEHRWT